MNIENTVTHLMNSIPKNCIPVETSGSFYIPVLYCSVLETSTNVARPRTEQCAAWKLIRKSPFKPHPHFSTFHTFFAPHLSAKLLSINSFDFLWTWCSTAAPKSSSLQNFPKRNPSELSSKNLTIMSSKGLRNSDHGEETSTRITSNNNSNKKTTNELLELVIIMLSKAPSHAKTSLSTFENDECDPAPPEEISTILSNLLDYLQSMFSNSINRYDLVSQPVLGYRPCFINDSATYLKQHEMSRTTSTNVGCRSDRTSSLAG